MAEWIGVSYDGVEFCYDTIFISFRVILEVGFAITKRCRIQIEDKK